MSYPPMNGNTDFLYSEEDAAKMRRKKSKNLESKVETICHKVAHKHVRCIQKNCKQEGLKSPVVSSTTKNKDDLSEVKIEHFDDVKIGRMPPDDDQKYSNFAEKEKEHLEAQKVPISTSSLINISMDDSPNTINILLMGETGVGKSTFINSFANYIKSRTFTEALKIKASVIIPTRITVYDDRLMEDLSLALGSDINEIQEIGSSATQSVQTYIFPIENEGILIRLIDTPGLGDTRGVNQDDQNSEEILSYLAQLKKINAICLLMKPNNDRDTVLFSYCIRRILSQLHKSASNNVVFLFTNTKGSEYRPGATVSILKRMAEAAAKEPPFVKIPVNRENVFCLENESFKYLLAKQEGVEINRRTLESCKVSWSISCEEIVRFIEYIRNITPHNVKQTVSINTTRDLILQMSKPLSDIRQLLEEKIVILKEKEELCKKSDENVNNLVTKLLKPTVDLEVIALDGPVLVCTNEGCVKKETIGKVTHFLYEQKCHKNCLLGFVLHEVLGHWSIRTCENMTWGGYCKKCDCSYSKHMHIYYDNKIVEKKIIDDDVMSSLENEKNQRGNMNRIIEKMKKEKEELENESKFISECAARFSYFLQNNALMSTSDVFKEYLSLSLGQQRTLKNPNLDVISNLQETLRRHEDLKKVLEEQALEDAEKINEESINEDVEKLFRLKHTGPKIQVIFDARAACIQKSGEDSFKNFFTEKVPNWFFGRRN